MHSINNKIFIFSCTFFQYACIADLERDFIQLCHNAQKYNKEGSAIYEDSIILETVFSRAKAQVESEIVPHDEEQNIEIDNCKYFLIY